MLRGALDLLRSLGDAPSELVAKLRDDMRARWQHTHGPGRCGCRFAGSGGEFEPSEPCRVRWRLVAAIELLARACELAEVRDREG